jgi:hypothetical protein
MLTSVKVQFATCLVDSGSCLVARPLIRQGGGGLQSDKGDEAGCQESVNAVAEFSFPIEFKLIGPASELENAESALGSGRAQERRPNQSH